MTSTWRLIPKITTRRQFTTSQIRNRLEQPSPPIKERSRHAQWYSDTLPGMLPIALIAFTVYGLLELGRSTLAQERRSILHEARIAQLEQEIAVYRARKETPIDSQPGAKQTGRWWTLWLL